VTESLSQRWSNLVKTSGQFPIRYLNSFYSIAISNWSVHCLINSRTRSQSSLPHYWTALLATHYYSMFGGQNNVLPKMCRT
jgi:hypothetical protein